MTTRPGACWLQAEQAVCGLYRECGGDTADVDEWRNGRCWLAIMSWWCRKWGHFERRSSRCRRQASTCLACRVAGLVLSDGMCRAVMPDCCLCTERCKRAECAGGRGPVARNRHYRLRRLPPHLSHIRAGSCLYRISSSSSSSSCLIFELVRVCIVSPPPLPPPPVSYSSWFVSAYLPNTCIRVATCPIGVILCICVYVAVTNALALALALEVRCRVAANV